MNLQTGKTQPVMGKTTMVKHCCSHNGRGYKRFCTGDLTEKRRVDSAVETKELSFNL